MTEARQIRADNHAAKRAAGFRCEHRTPIDVSDAGLHRAGGSLETEGWKRCAATDQLLVCTDSTREDGRPVVLCAHHVEQADGRQVRPRPHQWDEAQREREALEGKRSA